MTQEPTAELKADADLVVKFLRNGGVKKVTAKGVIVDRPATKALMVRAADTIEALSALPADGEGEPCRECDAVSAAIGGVEFMDPPDGGDVSLSEQVRRMRSRLDALPRPADGGDREKVREAAERVLRCDREAPEYGLCDQIDNGGAHYKSADLEAALLDLRTALSSPTERDVAGLRYTSVKAQEPPKTGWFLGWDGEFPEVWSGENYHGSLSALPGIAAPHWLLMKENAEKVSHWADLPPTPTTGGDDGR